MATPQAQEATKILFLKFGKLFSKQKPRKIDLRFLRKIIFPRFFARIR
jgi:hypothetical protein